MRRLIAGLTALFLLLSILLCSTVITSAAAHRKGDVDLDGEVTILDATVIQRVLIDMEWEPFNEKAADVNGNGLDVTDATLIRRFETGLIDHFPIEYETANG